MNTSLVTSLALKTASMVLIVSTIVDIVFTLLPYQLSDGRWWAAATSELVNRGLLPLVGIVFWLIADWIETVSKEASGRGSGNLTKGITALALLLGVAFLAIVPYQAWTGNSERDKAMTANKEQVAKLETRIKQELSIISDKTKIQQQIAEWDKLIKEGKIQGQDLAKIKSDKANLEQMASDPAKVKAKSDEVMTNIRKQQQEAEGQATALMWKTGIRTALASLLLSAGYSFIGLTGLRGQKR
jgi:hypothetical protein